MLLCGAMFTSGVLIGLLGMRLSLAPSAEVMGGHYVSIGDLWAWVALFMVVVSPVVTAGCWLLVRSMLRPLTGITAAVRRSGPHNLTQRVHLVDGLREIDELSRTIDALLDRLATGYDGQRRFAANASHELRTPLAAQRTLIEVALEAPDASDDLRRLGPALLAINERNENTIEGLLTLVETERRLQVREPVRLDEITRHVTATHLDLADRHQVTIVVRADKHVVQGEEVLLERLVANLVRNGIQYNRPGGRLEITVGGQHDLTVRNTGAPIPPEHVPGLFEPFRRLDRSGKGGAGLGLSIVRSIVTAHGGVVEASANDDGGLCVRVELAQAMR